MLGRNSSLRVTDPEMLLYELLIPMYRYVKCFGVDKYVDLPFFKNEWYDTA